MLRPWLKTDLAAYPFSPRESMEDRWAEQRRNRVTPLTLSQRARTRKRNPRKALGDRYTPDSYRQAIVKGCKKADVPAWHPHQLRHNAGTWLRKEFGLDVARIVLGHSSPVVTEIYAELDRSQAIKVMEQVG